MISHRISRASMELLVPLHLLLDRRGFIVGCGPALQKIPGSVTIGRSFFEQLEVIRPEGITDFQQLETMAGQGILLRFLNMPDQMFKAVGTHLDHGRTFFLQFGLHGDINALVKKLGLSGADFSPADTTIDLLFSLEVQQLILKNSVALNKRLNSQKSRAERDAETDPLTGLLNRRGFQAVLDRLERQPPKKGVGILHIDLDHFKKVNDGHGHEAGDRVLSMVAQKLQAHCRDADRVARLGGDEFVVLVAGMEEEKPLADLAWRLVASIEEPLFINKNEFRISASVGGGLSIWYTPFYSDELVRSSDEALYAAKSLGSGQVVIG